MECCSAAEVRQYGYTHAGYLKRTNVKKMEEPEISGGSCVLWELDPKPSVAFPLHATDFSISLC